MRSDFLPEIDWGKTEPTRVFNYYQADGTIAFCVGHFTAESGKSRKSTMYYNGVEWIKKMPDDLKINRPPYNLMRIIGTRPINSTLIIAEDERIADDLEYHLKQWEMDQDFCAVSFHGGPESIIYMNKSDFSDRRVLVWPTNNDRARGIKNALYTLLISEVSEFKMIPLDTADGRWHWGPVEYFEDGNISAIRTMMEASVAIDPPKIDIELDENGLCDLETPPPDYFIEAIKAKFGKPVLGKMVMPQDYFTCMGIAREDEAFEKSVKFDRAIGSAVWKTDRYPSIDDLKNAYLRRLAMYGVSPSPQARHDLFDTLVATGKDSFNSVHDYLDKLVEKHLSGVERMEGALEELFSYIDIPDEIDLPLPPDKQRYIQAMDHFFRVACFHILFADTQSPVPNEVVPVFVGEQGTGKTRLTRFLAVEPRWYGEITSNVSIGSPDFSRKILGRLIIELGEMNIYKKSDVDTVKAVISQAYDEFTPKFKEGVKKFPRVASFIGTSNNSLFLRDKTGNRRFFPIHIKRVKEDLFKQKDLIERVWANYWYDAKDAWQYAGVRWKDPEPGMIEYFKALQEHSVDYGPTMDRLISVVRRMERIRYDINDKENRLMVKISSDEILSEAFGTGVPWSAKEDLRVVMRRLGYEYRTTRSGGLLHRCFVIDKNDAYLIKRLKEEPNF